MVTHYCTMTDFLLDIGGHLDLLRPGIRIEIGEKDERVIMIHPDDYNRLEAHQVKNVFEADERDLDKRNKKNERI